MRRREFIALIAGAALAWPLAARAQQTDQLPGVGVLMSGADDDPEDKAWYSALVQGLAALGWADNRNVHLVTRWAAGDSDRLKAFATEMVNLKPEVIVATGTVSLLAVSQRTRSIPIVFAQVTDPVGNGLVASLAHPGGNITGFANFEYAIAGKWLELLRELVPQISRVAVIMNPDNSGHPGYLRMVETAASAASIAVTTAEARDAADIERTVNAFAPGPDASLIVLPDVVTVAHRGLIFSLAAHYRSPAIYPYPFFANDGGLIAYGINGTDIYRRAASYIDRILKGAKPGDLPIQEPTQLEMVVNLKTAKAMGLAIPESFLLRADQVIE
jgi:ABC-type uncharacterized transport system substrate-binding protein